MPYLSLKESEEKLLSAQKFFSTWKATSIAERIDVLNKALSYFESVRIYIE